MSEWDRLKKAAKTAWDDTRGAAESAGKSLLEGGGFIDLATLQSAGEGVSKVLTPKIVMPDQPEKKVMPIPDEELSKRSRRRARARRKGGRSSSILSDSDSLG